MYLFVPALHAATHCNTLQHTATLCNTLQHSATHCNTLQHSVTLCNTLQHPTTHCNTLQHTVTLCNTLQRTATRCNMLQHVLEFYENNHCQHSGAQHPLRIQSCDLFTFCLAFSLRSILRSLATGTFQVFLSFFLVTNPEPCEFPSYVHFLDPNTLRLAVHASSFSISPRTFSPGQPNSQMC